jgi:hypothetical protein
MTSIALQHQYAGACLYVMFNGNGVKHLRAIFCAHELLVYQMQFSVSVLLITTVDHKGKAKVSMQVSVSHVPCLNEVQLSCIPWQLIIFHKFDTVEG